MEDPAKRKERLQAMRTEATEIDVSTSLASSVNPAQLSNPLAETSGVLPNQEESCQTQRFDYYTDPMSAYSSHKRNKTDQQIQQQHSLSPCNPSGPPFCRFPPSIPGSTGNAHQEPNRPRGVQAGHYNPRPVYHGAPHEGWNNFTPPAGNFRPFQNNRPMAGPFQNYQGSHGPGNRFGGRGSYNQHPIPGYARPFPNYGQQNANWTGRASGPGSGRGRGGGRNGGRKKYNNADLQTLAPQRLYDNSMAEDPWKYLKPVLWRNCSVSSSSSSTNQAWVPTSLVPQKPTVSEASNKSSNTRQSLAEYLAASLDEATSDKPSE